MVIDHSLVMEGIPDPEDQLGLLKNESFSYRTIFNWASLARRGNFPILCSSTCAMYPAEIFPVIVVRNRQMVSRSRKVESSSDSGDSNFLCCKSLKVILW